jgi:hypothetical protein
MKVSVADGHAHVQRLVSIVKMGTVLEELPKSNVLLCVFCGQKVPIQKIFIRKCFLSPVGKGFIKYAVQMGSGGMIYIPSLHKDWFRHLNVNGWIHRQHGDRINLLLLCENKESRLEIHKSLHVNEIPSR